MSRAGDHKGRPYDLPVNSTGWELFHARADAGAIAGLADERQGY